MPLGLDAVEEELVPVVALWQVREELPWAKVARPGGAVLLEPHRKEGAAEMGEGEGAGGVHTLAMQVEGEAQLELVQVAVGLVQAELEVLPGAEAWPEGQAVQALAPPPE